MNVTRITGVSHYTDQKENVQEKKKRSFKPKRSNIEKLLLFLSKIGDSIDSVN
jgi:hypothetical protein